MMRVCLLLVFLMIAIAGFGQLGQNTPLLRHSLVTKAEEYYNDKRYDSALIVYKQFLGEQKVDTAKDSLLRSEVFYKIGRMYRAYFYEPEHAEPYLDSSFQLQRILNTQNSIYFGKTLYELASINRSMGKFDFAMGFALKAILISDTHSDMRFRANCRIIIANINNSEGNYLMANKYYLEAIALLEESDPNSLLLTNYLNNLSVSYLRLKLYDSARYFVQRSLEINTKMDNHLGLANDLNTIAFLYMAQKKHVQAIPFLKQSLDIKQRIYGMEHPEVVIAIISFAKAYKEMHEFDTSLKYIQKGLVALIPDFKDENIHSYPIIDQMNNQLLAFLLMYEKSQVLDEMLKLKIDHRIIDLAIYNAEKADSLLELNRISFIRKGSKMHIREHFNSFYEFFLNSLFLKYKSEPNNELLSKIYRVIESNKALALMEDLKDYEIHHGFEIDSLLSREKTLQKQLTVNELAIKQAVGKEREKLENEVFEISVAYDKLSKTLDEIFPGYYQIKYKKEQKLKDLRETSITKNQSIMTFFDGEEYLFEMFISQDTTIVLRIEKDQEYNDHLQGLLLSVYSPHYMNDLSGSFVSLTEHGYYIYNKLFGELDLSQTKFLIVVPDGSLAYLPFDVLLTSKVNSKEINFKILPYLIQDLNISYTYSSGLLMSSTRDIIGETNKLLGVSFSSSGDSNREDLPGTDMELRAIEKIMKTSSNMFYGASELDFKKELSGDYDIIHVGLHGIVDSTKTGQIQLFFQKSGGQEDGVLQAHELYGINTTTRLVFLSACETGFGKKVSGEGVFSLARGFIHAGCQAVIQSMWKINDKSNLSLVKSFYQEITDNVPSHSALRNAKLNFISQSDGITAHPYQWAAIQHVGLGLKFKSSLNYTTVVMSILIIFLFIWRIISFNKRSMNIT